MSQGPGDILLDYMMDNYVSPVIWTVPHHPNTTLTQHIHLLGELNFICEKKLSRHQESRPFQVRF